MSATLLVAGGCHTNEPTSSDAPPRAVLLRGERITWVGRPADAPSADRVVDLGGAWLTPAFVDAHVHATATGLALTALDLSTARSAADCLQRVRAHASRRGGDVLGFGWDDFGWPEGGPPTGEELSAAAGGRTVLLERTDGHSCLVDAGTLATLPLADLEGVDVDADGAATGWLREAAAEHARMRVRARLPAEVLRAARRAATEHAAALGVGCFHEMGHPGLSGLEDALAWADGDWPVEVLVWWADPQPWLEGRPPLGLRPGGDLFLDGSIGTSTAAVSRGYPDGDTGVLFHDDDTVAAFFLACSRAGIAAGAHAIGDRAIEQATRALERCAAELGEAAVRACGHRLEHVELPTRAQVSRLAALGVIASMQPVFDERWGGSDGLYAARFGTAASCRSNPLRWFAEAGATLAFGSDATVTPMGPWAAVRAAVTHKGGLGLDAPAALRAHTAGGRRAGGQHDVGALRAGQRADIAVWEREPLGDPEDARCLATLVRGRVVHGSLEVSAQPDA